MIYFKVEDGREFCLSWRYYTGDHAAEVYLGAIAKQEKEQALTYLEQRIMRFFSGHSEQRYPANVFWDIGLFTECKLSQVITTVNNASDGKVIREYVDICTTVGKRSPEDQHIKKVARELTVGKMLSLDLNILPEIREIIRNSVFNNKKK
jgi:hypothetical protein